MFSVTRYQPHPFPPHRREGCFVLAIWCQVFHFSNYMRGRATNLHIVPAPPCDLGTVCQLSDSFELIFEDMAVRDLRVFAEALDGKLYHYRDSSGLECDTVLHRRNGTYALIEVKLGGEKLINDGAKALKTLAETIDTTKMKNPSFMMVVTAVGPYAYQRPDGVFVVPIGCLKD